MHRISALVPQLYIEVASHWLAKLNLVNEVLIQGYYTVKDQGVHIFTELGQLQLESIHSKMLSLQLKSGKQSGLRSWYSLLGFI